ncbi:hypothetical protein B484DRAFT_403114 [Ochromonadaceae sp. CCMP2298]|nr:hypothetical protein B484DRAFT_403114 [Ochromonadaceae sp. CCMP2298]
MGFNLLTPTGGSAANPSSGKAVLDRSAEVVFGGFKRDRADSRYREMLDQGRRELVPYNRSMSEQRVVHLHFYTYLYWEDYHTEQIYKRIVRDRLHYHDDIFCAAGRVVKLLHEASAPLRVEGTGEVQEGRGQVQGPSLANQKTLGGDSNHNATYFAFHIRRGDFQYDTTQQSAEVIWSNTRHLLDPSVSKLIYIATDEGNRSFFAPFMQAGFEVKFLADLAPQASLHEAADGFNMNHIGMVEQVICANAHTFVGTPYSTFTGYITRMRGYYRDGRYERTFYTLPLRMYDLQKVHNLFH